MCGRFTNNAKSEQIEKEFKAARKNANLFDPRYNIAPSQIIDVVFSPEAERILTKLKWGLVPSWMKC